MNDIKQLTDFRVDSTTVKIIRIIATGDGAFVRVIKDDDTSEVILIKSREIKDFVIYE